MDENAKARVRSLGRDLAKQRRQRRWFFVVVFVATWALLVFGVHREGVYVPEPHGWDWLLLVPFDAVVAYFFVFALDVASAELADASSIPFRGRGSWLETPTNIRFQWTDRHIITVYIRRPGNRHYGQRHCD